MPPVDKTVLFAIYDLLASMWRSVAADRAVLATLAWLLSAMLCAHRLVAGHAAGWQRRLITCHWTYPSISHRRRSPPPVQPSHSRHLLQGTRRALVRLGTL